MTRIEFNVVGKPQQRGSKRPFVTKPKDGRQGKIVVPDDNPRSKGWMLMVGLAAEAVVGDADLLRGPLRLSAVFRFSRPALHYGTGRNRQKIKNSAPKNHFQTPDLSKLMRAIEDGMTGIVYHDDRQISEYGPCWREWTSGVAGCTIVVETLESEG